MRDFESAKEKFEKQRKEVEETLKAIRGEKEREDMEEFNPMLPVARYPKPRAMEKATEDVQKWFNTEVLKKPLISTEQWKTSAVSPHCESSFDLIYLTEVHAVAPSRPVLPASDSNLPAVPRLEVEFQTPNDSFEDVSNPSVTNSEESFEEIN